MRAYKCLSTQIFRNGIFSIEPIRDEDQYEILKIRNEQIYHLRQAKPLTVEAQENYFATVVSNLFEQENPNQLLFSFFENEVFIGYGGLVHINWIDRNAEISFVMKTELESTHFIQYWSNYLTLIEKVAFEDLNFHKIFTYAFDLRPHLYAALLISGFKEEARLKEHCFFEGQFLDVVYHAKINSNITSRKANENDMLLYFEWTNEESVREASYHSEPIPLESHQQWFLNKIKDPKCFMMVFENHFGAPVGQVRIEKQESKNALIGISNDVKYRGKGYAAVMIQMASAAFLEENPETSISAFIKTENKASEKAFTKAGYILEGITEYESIPSYHYIKKL